MWPISSLSVLSSSNIISSTVWAALLTFFLLLRSARALPYPRCNKLVEKNPPRFMVLSFLSCIETRSLAFIWLSWSLKVVSVLNVRWGGIYGLVYFFSRIGTTLSNLGGKLMVLRALAAILWSVLAFGAGKLFGLVYLVSADGRFLDIFVWLSRMLRRTSGLPMLESEPGGTSSPSLLLEASMLFETRLLWLKLWRILWCRFY